MTREGVLATEGGIPWHLPRDIARFRREARGKHILLGRVTYEEMRGWFQADQTALVLTWREIAVPEGFPVGTVEEAVRLAEGRGAVELLVAGGAQVYAVALPWVSRMLLTIIEADLVGLVRFPSLDWNEWHRESEEHFPRDADHVYAMRFQTWSRRAKQILPCDA